LSRAVAAIVAAVIGVPTVDFVAHWFNVAPHFVVGGVIVLCLIVLIYI